MIQKLDTQTRELLPMYDALLLYIPRKEEIRGIVCIETIHKITEEGIINKLQLKEKKYVLENCLSTAIA